MSTTPLPPLGLLLIAAACSCPDEAAVGPDGGDLQGPDAATILEEPDPTPPPPPWTDREVEVADGTTISRILQENGLSSSEVLALVEAGRPIHSLESIRAGEKITIRADRETGAFVALLYPLDRHGEQRLVVMRTADGTFLAKSAAKDLVRVPVDVSAVITSSLWDSVTGMGLSWDTAVALTSIFEWEIDFNSQVREGDVFKMVIEEVRDPATGVVLRHDRILAAEYVNAGKSCVGIRWEGHDGTVGYFDRDGMSSRMMFLKSPLKFTRISSGFGRRYHPVLKQTRNHNGIDYAAPTGTPVRAIGRGVVTYAGTKGGHGKHVRIRHSDTYSSAYSHLSQIAVKKGQSVGQGDLIGKVGTTGLSTGPHLHFEFYVNGVFTNFLVQKFPRTEPISDAERPAFEALRDVLAPRLASIAMPGAAPPAAETPSPAAEPGPAPAAEIGAG